ncbi:chaperonin, putative [Talaromyces stipitatus ATCC 10500]|uniref:Chaperonin, putative n=1 Tax=Talaromyces stipitatus (strain ATCC 10500 / CBS 375.48 / QM 6759 / NRRL 1006) TaxID=441959 RepID=B8MRK5_TALSN|nr:chaperonin, putative [Talaromyces stipitatus ATCC 10500]EED13162.1 chaperonin, putative [Talaromyces stipitatus ATCC 10500]
MDALAPYRLAGERQVLAFWKFLARNHPFILLDLSIHFLLSQLHNFTSLSCNLLAITQNIHYRNAPRKALEPPRIEAPSIQIIHSYANLALRNIKNLVPLLDRVLVQRIKPEAKTASGIFLPESTVKDINQATVLAVGPGALDRNGNKIPMSVASGDKVLIPQFGGSPVKVGDEEYTLFRDSE